VKNFKGARLNSVGSYLSKDLYVYPLDSNNEPIFDDGNYILDMDFTDGRGAYDWYQHLSSEDKTIVDVAVLFATVKNK